MESTIGWGYEGYGAKARDGNELREVEMWHHGENVCAEIDIYDAYQMS